MNKTISTIAASIIGLALSAPVMAGGSTAVVAGVGAQAGNEGNNQSITTVNEAADLGRSVPTAVAPALTTTLSETCMGSTSVGGSGAGFGFSIGSTWRDEACVRRLDARELRAMGAGAEPRTQALFALAGKERMCADDEVRAAFERVAAATGNDDILCQATADAKKGGKTAAYVEGINEERVARPEAVKRTEPTFQRRNPALDGN